MVIPFHARSDRESHAPRPASAPASSVLPVPNSADAQQRLWEKIARMTLLRPVALTIIEQIVDDLLSEVDAAKDGVQ
jgi:hypothetical protein